MKIPTRNYVKVEIKPQKNTNACLAIQMDFIKISVD